MKALLLFLFIFSSSSFGQTINSMTECNVALYKAQPQQNSYALEGSRIEGETAVLRAERLRTKGLVKDVFDVLGIKRYEKTEHFTVIDSFGTDLNSCKGVYFALRVDTCTINDTTEACEIFCKLEWRGVDCR
jgi:hypothetical protein